MRISDWSSDVCSSDLLIANYRYLHSTYDKAMTYFPDPREDKQSTVGLTALWDISRFTGHDMAVRVQYIYVNNPSNVGTTDYDRQLVMTGLQIGFLKRLSRSEEHTSELQSLMRISYAVFSLRKKTNLYKT